MGIHPLVVSDAYEKTNHQTSGFRFIVYAGASALLLTADGQEFSLF
jgi:hypothetical protein